MAETTNSFNVNSNSGNLIQAGQVTSPSQTQNYGSGSPNEEALVKAILDSLPEDKRGEVEPELKEAIKYETEAPQWKTVLTKLEPYYGTIWEKLSAFGEGALEVAGTKYWWVAGLLKVFKK